MSPHTPGPWGPMNDGPVLNRKPWEPWTAYMEAAPGLTLASRHNTEPICRVSGYLQPVEANARLIAAAPALLEALDSLCSTPAVQMALGTDHTKGCACPFCRARAALALARPTQDSLGATPRRREGEKTT